MKDAGFIYILKNESMPTYYKVGLTRKSVESRIQTLRTTAIPCDFVCIYSSASEWCLQLEKFIHKELADKRVNTNREFFKFPDDHSAKGHVLDVMGRFEPRQYTEKEIVQISAMSRHTPAAACKAQGLPSLKIVCEVAKTSPQTLSNWFHNKPALFAVVLAGVKSIKEKGDE